MSQRFTAVSWVPNQLLDVETLNTYTQNMQYLRNESVDGAYQHGAGGITGQGIKILCGSNGIGPWPGNTMDMNVYFSKMFTVDSNPVITTSLVSENQRALQLVLRGLGTVIPNHQGFLARIFCDEQGGSNFPQIVYVNWIAMGY